MKMDVSEFDRVAREVFAPAYVAIARQILDETGVARGKALDLGAGGGYLSLALARITTLDIVLLDQLPEMQKIAQRNIVDAGLEKRLRTLMADVHEIPLEGGSVDLVFSRGSVFFWKDQVRAFREIYRVLAPGGRTFIGGGFGSVALKKQIDEKMVARQKDWLHMTRARMNATTMTHFRAVLEKAGVPHEIRQVEAGFGIMIKREDA
ncbi:MAG: class I SAM-dependent methyltransferase [Syntrophales bacterium]|jgi:ubiquinone/menaquinone biosynthesis C-methylase UbiE|nr:class I SAM-dependent methyltransferase [Syntrophales bacterium]